MKMTDDLTRGNIEKQLIALAFPLILGNILQQLYNTIDSFIVGRYIGHTAFAAIGVAGSIMNLFIFVLVGGCNGISVIFAGLYGEKNWKLLKKESFLSLSFGGMFAILLSAAGIWALNPLLKSIQTPEEVRVFAYDYLWIIYLGLPAAFLYNWCSAVLRAVGDTKTALWALLSAMLMNFILDVFLVVYRHMGISGTAAATVVSQLFSAIVCLIYIKYRYPDLLFSRKDMEFDRRLLWKTVNFGFVSALYQSSLYIGKLLVQGAVNRAGTDIISAYTATMRVEGFANSFGDSGSASLSVFAAQNQGAGNERRVRQGFLKGLRMMVLLGIGLSGLMLLTTKSVIFLLMGEVSVKIAENADAYMRVISLFYVLCYVGSSFVGLYRGLGMIHIPVAGTILHISIRVILSYLLLGRMGLPAVALATGAGWTAFAVFQGSLYRKKIKKGEIPRCL